MKTRNRSKLKERCTLAFYTVVGAVFIGAVSLSISQWIVVLTQQGILK